MIVGEMEILGRMRRQKVGVLSMYSTQEWTCLGTDLINNKIITSFSLPFHLHSFEETSSLQTQNTVMLSIRDEGRYMPSAYIHDGSMHNEGIITAR